MISVEQRGRVHVVSPIREVDIVNSTELDSLISEAGKDRPVVISLAECVYCDSAAIAAFITAKKKLGDRFAMYIPERAAVRRVFEVTKMTDYLAVFSNLDDAVNFVSAPS